MNDTPSEQAVAEQMALAKYAMTLSTRAVRSLVTRSGSDEEVLRSTLDIVNRTRALAGQDPVAEHLTVTLLRAALDEVVSHHAGRTDAEEG